MMIFTELKTRVHQAIDTLYARDGGLFSVQASEWAIAHRLAVYLEKQIPGWNVDCEYNKQGEGGGLSAKPHPNPNPKPGNENKNVRPDIILHHRGQTARAHNLLVIELKKQNEDSDSEKARQYTSKPDPNANNRRKYQYQYGLALSYSPKLELHWYANGTEI